MKKIIAPILALLIVLCASSWSSDVKIALEMEGSGNPANTGSGAETWTNGGSIPYSTSIFYEGLQSIGLINTSGQHVQSSSTSAAYKTIQFSAYAVSAGLPTDAEYLDDSNVYIRFYVYSAAMYYDFSGGSVGPMTLGAGGWVVWQADYDGTHVDVWRGTGSPATLTHQGQVTTTHQPGYGTVYYNLGNYPGYNTTNYCNCYLDNVLFSTTNYAGTPISTIAAATPTPNYTQTAIASMTQGIQTETAQAVATLTATWNTPTPQYTPPMCLTPMWTPILTPIIVAQATWEGGCVVEPNVVQDDTATPDKRFKLVCTNNAFYLNGSVETIEEFTAPSMTGPWTRYGTTPIIGGGYGGEPHPCGQAKQVVIGGQWRIYFSDLTNRNVWYATSTDGYNYTSQFPGISITPVVSTAQWIPFGCSGGSAVDGAGLVWDGSKWWNIEEVNAQNCPIAVPYALWLMSDATSDAEYFNVASAEPLMGMNPFNPTPHLFGGSRGILKTGSNYYNATSVDVPTSLYMSVSNDLFNWRTSLTPIATPYASLFGLTSCNQAVDGTMLETTDVNGGKNVYVVYDGTDNPNGACAIGLMIHHGSAASMDACTNPTVTFTPTFTYTNTPTFTFTNTPTDTATNTPTKTPRLTFTNTPTFTLTYTSTVTPTITVTKVVTPRATRTVTLTVTPTKTRTPTFTPTGVASIGTRTATCTLTPTKTPILFHRDTPTLTPTRCCTKPLIKYTPTLTPVPVWIFDIGG